MKLLLATAIAVAFAASPVCAQQPADKDKDKAATATDATSQDASAKPTETVEPVAVSADANIAPEVMEVVNKKKKYSTSDLVKAQLDAVNRPAG